MNRQYEKISVKHVAQNMIKSDISKIDSTVILCDQNRNKKKYYVS